MSTNWIQDELLRLDEKQTRRTHRCRQSPPVSGLVQIDGEQYIDFSSNDYLGLAADSRLVDAVKSVAGQTGWGAGSSPLVAGRGIWHRRLEQELAKLKQTESALLFSTGFAANVGTITALVGDNDIVFSDERNHASIIDGCRLSKAEICIYRHLDLEHLRECLATANSRGRKLIVTDSLFSMDGDFAPLAELCKLAVDNDAMLMVDEAHATGVWGQQGRGVCEMLNVEDQVPIRVGTLSKALGSLGGFLAGSQELIDLVLNKARTYMFSTAQPEAAAAASLAAIQALYDEPARRQRVIESSKKLRADLSEQGWDLGNSQSQIIPVILRTESAALEMSESLRSTGIFVPAIRPPAVPSGKSMLRISLTSAHSDDQLQALMSALRQLQPV